MLNKVYQDKVSKKMVRAILFNGEKWLYERKDAYPMVESKDSKPHQGIFGMSYEPVIVTTNGEKVIENGDFIIQEIEGNIDICKSIEFDNLYELVKWDRDDYFEDKQNEVIENFIRKTPAEIAAFIGMENNRSTESAIKQLFNLISSFKLIDNKSHDKINLINFTVKLDNIALNINEGDSSLDKKEEELRNILKEIGTYSFVYASDRLKDMSFLDEFPEWKERASKVLLEFTV